MKTTAYYPRRILGVILLILCVVLLFLALTQIPPALLSSVGWNGYASIGWNG